MKCFRQLWFYNIQNIHSIMSLIYTCFVVKRMTMTLHKQRRYLVKLDYGWLGNKMRVFVIKKIYIYDKPILIRYKNELRLHQNPHCAQHWSFNQCLKCRFSSLQGLLAVVHEVNSP